MSATTMKEGLARMPAEVAALRWRAVVSGAIGNFVELFDFIIFGLFAAPISANFFPSGDKVASLLAAFAAYGVGFIARPLGAVVLGVYGDRHGRKAALVVTVGVMALTTGLTGLIPSYAAIGAWSPLLLVLCRLVQGFSTGGEWGGAAAFLVEYAPPGRRGFIGSLHQSSAALAMTASTLLAAVLNHALGREAMLEYGWRIPFIFGFLLAPIGLYLRSRVFESPAFEDNAAHERLARAPLREAIGIHRLAILSAFGIAAAGTATNYTFMIFFPVFASGHLDVPPTVAFYSTAAASALVAFVAPLSGMVSDRIGRRLTMLLSAGGMLVFGWPLFRLAIYTHDVAGFFVTQMIAAVFLGIGAGALVALLCELFPTRVRYTALSIGYSFAVTIFGGFAPFAATFLVRWTGRLDAPAFYIVALSAVSCLTLCLIRDPTNAPLE